MVIYGQLLGITHQESTLMAREEMRGMKRFWKFALVVILLTATFPSIALGSETTTTVEPPSSVVESTTPLPVPMVPVVSPKALKKAVEATASVLVKRPPKTVAVEATESAEPTITPPPPPSEETTETTETPEPYSADNWANLGSGIDSREWPGSNKNPEWVRWTIAVTGVSHKGGSIDVAFKNTELEGIEVSRDGSYVFETPGHDILLEAHFGALITPGEESDVKPSIKLVKVEFGPERPVPVVKKTAEPEPYLAYTDSDPEPEPFLPFTGGSEILPWTALIFGIWGARLRRASARR